MPECSFHKGVQTSVTCIECGRYICPKDMIDTPVGYKCHECGRTRRPTLGGVKPRQLALGAAAGLGAAAVGGLVLAFVPWFGLFTAIIYGAAVGEATRRGSSGHRTWEFAAIAALAAFLGTFVSLLLGDFRWNYLAGILGPIAAVFFVTSSRW